MKRFLALNLLFIIVLSMAIPIFYPFIKTKYDIKEPVVLTAANVTYEVKEIVKEPDPYEKAITEMQQELKKIESIENREEWYLSYKNIISNYSEWIDPPETIFDYFTEDEIRLICKVVETECYDADFESKVNVANVVLNRLNHEKFGDTIGEVITTENQFAYGRDNITDSTINAVMYAFEIEDTTKGALYFHSNKKTDKFNGANYLFTDNVGHHFYG